ncbi:MAG: molybdopterin-binding protein [Lachnospiraceae bacterium]
MKLINTEEAIGHVLCHDMTQIIPGEFKDAVYRKGHIVTEEDIPILLSMGKKHLYVWEKKEGMVHEDDAAVLLKDICIGPGMVSSEIKEGKVTITASVEGMFQVNSEKLRKINGIGEVIIATCQGNYPVRAGDKLAAARVVPLVIRKELLDETVKIADGKPLLSILPYQAKKAYIITTGSEVYSGRIRDAFGPALSRKLAEYNVQLLGQKILDDDPEEITMAIHTAVSQGADLILCTGGMSVDPDDTTPAAIKNTGAHVVTYGAPVLPGAMLLLAYLENEIPVIGLPGCVMYSRRTIFDLILPRILAGELLKKEDLTDLGEGGLCLNCDICHFPNCGFGK